MRIHASLPVLLAAALLVGCASTLSGPIPPTGEARTALLAQLDREDSALSSRIRGLPPGVHYVGGFFQIVGGFIFLGKAFSAGWEGEPSQHLSFTGLALQISGIGEIAWGTVKLAAQLKRKKIRKRRNQILAGDSPPAKPAP